MTMGKSPLRKTHHCTKFGADRQCGGGNIMVLISHVISQYNATERSSGFIGKSASR